jgi:hypothetical protein
LLHVSGFEVLSSAVWTSFFGIIHPHPLCVDGEYVTKPSPYDAFLTGLHHNTVRNFTPLFILSSKDSPDIFQEIAQIENEVSLVFSSAPRRKNTGE